MKQGDVKKASMTFLKVKIAVWAIGLPGLSIVGWNLYGALLDKERAAQEIRKAAYEGMKDDAKGGIARLVERGRSRIDEGVSIDWGQP